MKKFVFIKLAIAILLFSSNLFSQVTQEWVRTYTNPHGIMSNSARKIALDAAGNIYVTGLSNDSISGYDFATIKYNANGVQQWIQRYNGSGNDYDEAIHLVVDAAGNVFVGGYSKGSALFNDYALIKYNTNGVQQWVKRFNNYEMVSDIAIDNVGNLYVLGRKFVPIPHPHSPSDSASAFKTIKYNSSGNQVWVKYYIIIDTSCYNTPYSFPYAMAVDINGNIYVSGYCSDGDCNFMGNVNIKYNSFGDSLWVRKTYAYAMTTKAIAINTSGYVSITGINHYQGIIYNEDYITQKYSSSGVHQWVQSYNGTGDSIDRPSSIVVDLNNVYITGTSMGSTTGYDYTTIKYDFSGVQQWVRRYNGSGNGHDYAFSIKIDTMSNTYVTGWSKGSGSMEDVVTIKYDFFGNQKWLARYNGVLNGSDAGMDMAINSSGNIFVTGSSEGKYITIKYSQQVGIQNISTEIPSKYSLSQNYPNPFNPIAKIKFDVPACHSSESWNPVILKVYDVMGREVQTLVNESLKPGTYEATFDGSQLTSGVYFYKLSANGFVKTKRMILIK
jgi:hypothetical protein